MTKTEFVKELNHSELERFFIDHFNEDERIDIFREVVVYCNENNEADFFPFDEDEINERISSPYEAMRAAHFGDVDWNDSWLRINVYGNLESISNITDFMLGYIDELEDYITDNYEDELCEYFAFGGDTLYSVED